LAKLFREFLGIAAHHKAGEIFKSSGKLKNLMLAQSTAELSLRPFLRLTRIEGRWAGK
jgi:hypothetical protein